MEPLQWDIVGPVCESADFLAHDRMLALSENDLLVVRSAGAYAMTMSSNYNARPRACEVIVDGTTVHLVRRREHVDELFANESRLPASVSPTRLASLVIKGMVFVIITTHKWLVSAKADKVFGKMFAAMDRSANKLFSTRLFAGVNKFWNSSAGMVFDRFS